MAGQIYGFNQVFDSNGDPLPGALLYTYVPNTTTPKATYTDTTLGVQLPNPVVADSAGRFPQIFADDGAIYDLVLKTAAAVTVQSYYDVTALGESSADINIDFGLDGRFRVIGSGGEPNIEFGDPIGDDVGGDGRIGGWNATQGTSLEIDFATTTFTGAIRNSTYAEPFPRLLATGSAAAVASLDLPLDAAFSSWELQITNYKGSVTSEPRLRLSFDGGATYKSGAADYQYEGLQQTNAAAERIAVTNAAHIALIAAPLDTTNGGMLITTTISSSVGNETRTLSQFGNFAPADVTQCRSGMMAGTTNNTNYGKATNIRILTNAGTATFSYRLIGIPG